jgi:hypothetical protein
LPFDKGVRALAGAAGTDSQRHGREASGYMESLIEFWAIVVDVWNNTAFGTSFGRIVVAVGVFALFLVVRRLFAHFVISWLKRIAAKTATDIDDRTIGSLEKPLRFVPIVFGFFIATEALALAGAFDEIAANITRSLVTFTFFWGIVALVEPLSFMLGRLKDVFSETMVSWFVKAIKILFMFIGAAAILDVWGIEIRRLGYRDRPDSCRARPVRPGRRPRCPGPVEEPVIRGAGAGRAAVSCGRLDKSRRRR